MMKTYQSALRKLPTHQQIFPAHFANAIICNPPAVALVHLVDISTLNNPQGSILDRIDPPFTRGIGRRNGYLIGTSQISVPHAQLHLLPAPEES